jgi:ABC-type sugar transport system substrate-binding protein
VKLVYVTPSGDDQNDAAARADAIKVATEIKAFASWGGPIATTAYAEELAARKVLCICTISQPNEFYTSRAPYVISALMSNTEGYIHRAEYIGKRLANRPAKHAGDPLMTGKTRTFGLLYYETAEQSYRSGVQFFEKELSKYGVKLAERLAFTGANNDNSATQEQARTLIARLMEKGVTSVVYAGDPLSPVFFTQEATRQRYSPEWILTGSAFTDTTFFART